MLVEQDLITMFSYHKPSEAQTQAIQNIRAAALRFGQVILRNTPPCADQTVAIRVVREAMMWANAAIVVNNSTPTEPIIERS